VVLENGQKSFSAATRAYGNAWVNCCRIDNTLQAAHCLWANATWRQSFGESHRWGKPCLPVSKTGQSPPCRLPVCATQSPKRLSFVSWGRDLASHGDVRSPPSVLMSTARPIRSSASSSSQSGTRTGGSSPASAPVVHDGALLPIVQWR